MKKIIALAALVFLLAPHAYGQETETMILFKLTGDEASTEHLDLINAEIFMILDGSGKYQLINADDLGEELMMGPAESLAFCNEEPGCIADIGAGKNARWIVFGDVKKSFDGAKFIVHLTMVDAKARKVHGEQFGSFEKEGNVVLESGNTIRLLVGLPLPEPKKEPETKKVADADADATELKDINIAPQKPKKKPKVIKKVAAPSGPSPFTNPWTLSAAGVGVASLTAGIILGVLSNQKIDDAKAAGDQPSGMSLVHEGEDLATGANIAFILGGAALAGAVVLFILDVTSDEPAVTPAVACTGTGCTATINLTFW
jgi:hypothetical protein